MNDKILIHDEFCDEDIFDSILKIPKESVEVPIFIVRFDPCNYYPLRGYPNQGHSLLLKIHELTCVDNAKNTYFITGDANVNTIYEEWCSVVNPDFKINVVSVPFWNLYLNHHTIPKNYEYQNTISVLKHKVISLNRLSKIHRLMLLDALYETPGFTYSALWNTIDANDGLNTCVPAKQIEQIYKVCDIVIRDKNYVTCGLHTNDNNPYKQCLLSDVVDDERTCMDYCVPSLGLTGIGEYYWELPHGFSTENTKTFESDNREDVLYEKYAPKEYFESFFDVVTESEATNSLYMTEKTWRPLTTGKPFLILGSKGQHELLSECGFELYDEFLDYSFDDMDFDVRLKSIIKQTKKICNYDWNTILQLNNQIKEKRIHNQNLIFSLLKGDQWKFMNMTLKDITGDNA